MRLLFLLLLCAGYAHANDSVIVGEGGRWRQMDGEHSQIQMVREKVVMTLGVGAGYRVIADFVFRNHGPRTVVTMGFPESGGGDLALGYFRHRSGFRGFRSWVDGRLVRVRRLPATEESQGYKTFWVKKVPFGQGQTRRVRVAYEAPFGASSVPMVLSASYSFTGGNWFGEVAQSELLVTLLTPGTHMVREDISEPTKPISHRRGNRFYHVWRNWQAQSIYDVWFLSTLPQPLEIDTNAVAELNRYIHVFNSKPEPTQQFTHLPTATVRNGHTFISLNSISNLLATKYRYAGVAEPPFDARSEWDSKRQRATLVFRGRRAEFQVGQRTMLWDRKRTVQMPGAPFLARAYNENTLYVPLRPILNVLGADAKIDKARHRLQLFMLRQKKG